MVYGESRKLNRKKLAVLLILALCITLIISGCSKDYVVVTFVVDGVEEFSYFVDKGSYLDEIPDVPIKDGMTGSWSVTDFDEITEDLRVYAVYNSDSYTITFMAEGEVYRTFTINKKRALSEIPEVPAKSGYTGVWNVTDFSLVRQNITVNAVYTLTQYAVKFFVSGEEYTTSYVDASGTLNNVPQVPGYPNKNYSGKWRINKGTEEAPVWEEPSYIGIKENIRLDAYYYITIDLENSFAVNTQKNLELDNEVALEDLDSGAKGAQYDFIGWYSDAQFREEIVFPYSFDANQAIYARWISNAKSEGFTFEGNTVTGYEGTEEEIILPYKNGENFITEIADNAFSGLGITKITLPSTLEVVGSNSFSNCASLEEIAFADENNIEIIESSAFSGCVNLASFDFSPYASIIGDNAFEGCLALTELNFLGQSKVTSIGSRAFYDCGQITEFVLPSTISEIKSSAFENAALAEFSFVSAANLLTIGQNAFKNCIRLTSLNAPNLTEIGEGAFAGCRSLSRMPMLSTQYLYKLFATDTDNSLSMFYEITDFDTTNGYFVPTSLRSVIIIGNENNLGVETLISYALYNCYTIKEISFSGTLSAIESYAFYSDNGLTATGNVSLVLPMGLKNINENAFITRNDITSVELPITLETIGERAFYQVNKLNRVVLAPNSALKSIGKEAFGGTEWCENSSGLVSLGRIVIGMFGSFAQNTENLTAEHFAGKDTIAPYAFFGQSKLKNVILGNNILTVGEYAFASCANLVSLEIAPEVTSIGQNILSGCRSFVKLTVGESVDIKELFGKDSYLGSFLMGEYYLPNTWEKLSISLDNAQQTTIKAGDFTGYSNFKEITVGEGFVNVEDGAFSDNINLTKVNFPSTLVEIGSVRYDTEEEAIPSVGVFYNSPMLSTVTFPQNSLLQYIREKAFINTALKSFTVANTVSLIEEYAFSNTKLEALYFVNNVSGELNIGSYAFSEITTFPSSFVITMPAQLRSLGEGAFKNNTSLRSVVLNNGLINIGKECFYNCNLQSFDLVSTVVLYENEEEYTEEECLVGSILYGNNNIALLKLYKGIPLSLLFGGNIPNNLVKIEINGGEIIENQFRDCVNIQEVIIRNVTAIKDYAFYGCNNINFKKVILPPSVMSIGDYAFANCTYLRSFDFSGDPTISSIGKYVFSDDAALLQVTIPTSVQNTVFEGLFKNCSMLTSTNIPSTVSIIGDYTYFGASSLESIDIPESVTEIGAFAFKDCFNMEMENINFSLLTSIGEGAFENCYLLRGIKAEGIESIGINAFNGCRDITEITIIEEAVSYYLTDVDSVVTINISSYANIIAENSFENCDNLRMIIVHSENNIEDMLLILAEESLGEDVRIFVAESSYSALSSQITESPIYSQLYPNPCLLNNAVYQFDSANMTAKLISAAFGGEVAFLPTYVYDGENKYTVTEISDGVFANNLTLKQVIIPYTIEKIGKYTFQQCTNLVSVIIETGSRLITIDEDAFFGCEKLEAFILPNSVKYINDRAFYGCAALSKFVITYGSTLISIGDRAFQDTDSLIDFSIQSPLESLGAYCFYNSNITTFSFGDNSVLTEIEEYTFGRCYNLLLTEEDLPSNITVVAETAFEK
jgi:hypothetical protein